MDFITDSLKTVMLHKVAFKPTDTRFMLRTDWATKTCLNVIDRFKQIKMISPNRSKSQLIDQSLVVSLHFESLFGCFNTCVFIAEIFCPFSQFFLLTNKNSKVNPDVKL